jgi:hypothetical protein
MRVKSVRTWISVCAVCITPLHVVGEPVGATFTYQGQLKEAGIPVDGQYDFLFRLYGDPSGGTPMGDVSVDNWPVTNGLFTVQLDFGSDVFNGDARWLEVAVRPEASSDGDPYTFLSPRQPVTPTPYALYALNAPGGGGSGHWTLNGNNIYNNNSGRVGIGTGSPDFTLHVHDTGGADAPPTTLGVRWLLPSLPVPQTDWFYFAVGGSAPTVGSGTRWIRESGTELHFQTRDGINTGWPATQMVLDAGGKLGIGTMTPDSMLEVETTAGVHGIRSTTPYIAMYAHRTGTSGTWPAIHAECDSKSEDASAIRAYITSTDPGHGSAAVRGVNNGNSVGIGVHGTHGGSGWGVFGEAPTGRAVYGLSDRGIGVYGKANTGYAGYFEGRVGVEVLEIRGADLAEKFPVSEEVKPGMVVAIDPKHPGKLCLARGAYNRCVAGVVSGANDLPAGAVLGHLPGHEDAPPVALSGRVWVHCDATQQPIEPGDLLTTAQTPGHAMAVTDYPRAQGAIIGKAMTSLDGGRGMVLVLVSLQ